MPFTVSVCKLFRTQIAAAATQQQQQQLQQLSHIFVFCPFGWLHIWMPQIVCCFVAGLALFECRRTKKKAAIFCGSFLCLFFNTQHTRPSFPPPLAKLPFVFFPGFFYFCYILSQAKAEEELRPDSNELQWNFESHSSRHCNELNLHRDGGSKKEKGLNGVHRGRYT